MENGCTRVSAGPQSSPASPKNYVYDHVLTDLGSGARGPVASHLPKRLWESLRFQRFWKRGQAPVTSPLWALWASCPQTRP